MIVAQIAITESSFSGAVAVHRIHFEDLAKANSEYERVAELIKRKAGRKNELPETIEVAGDGAKVTIPLDYLRAITLEDYAWANEKLNGVKDAFPNLFKV